MAPGKRKPPNNQFLSDVVASLARDGFSDVRPGSVKTLVPRQSTGYSTWKGFVCDFCRERFEDALAIVFLQQGSTTRFEVCTDRPACQERHTQYLAAKAANDQPSRRRAELAQLKQQVKL